MNPAHTDSAGVRVPPPLYYVVGLVAGVLMNRVLPVLPSLPHGAAAGGVLIALGLLLGLSAVHVVRRARTSVLPHRPSTAFVAAGPYRFTRNPM